LNDPAWRIDYAPPAQRDIRRFDPPIRARVILAIERTADNDPRADICKLAGSDEYRLRVGAWRVRFRRDPRVRRPARAAARTRLRSLKDGAVGTRALTFVARVLPRGRAYRD